MTALNDNTPMDQKGPSAILDSTTSMLEGPKSEKVNSSQQDVPEYPPLPKVIMITIALYLAIFLVALDRTIIATAIPRITDTFHSLGDIGWYGSAYLLTCCSFQLVFGRIYTFYSPKWVFLSAILLFEVGSVICGAAPSSTAFIVGRAIAGIGSSGLVSGGVVIIVHIAPLHKRPMYTGLLGAVFGIASVVAPLMGGAFTENVSWRWCFYINLPIGAVTIAIIALILHLPEPPHKDLSTRERLAKLDPLGTAVFLPGMVCLLLALQWGGSTYPWSSGRVIALLVVSAILLLTFIAIQAWKQDSATVPPRILLHRSILSGFWYTFALNGAMLVILYYLPIWFQAIKDASAVNSGIMTLPLILGLVVGSILAGAGVTRSGYYTPFMILASILLALGSGLMTTFTQTTNHSKWIGYQVCFGLGLGIGMQQPAAAAQTVLAPADVSTGVSLVFFAQYFGGALWVSVANNVFANRLVSIVEGIGGVDARSVVGTGATAVREVVPEKALGVVLRGYNEAVVQAFYVAVACACATVVGALGMEWRSMKAQEGKKGGGIQKDGKDGLERE
ncbi:major facilitator superfamily domain-containing protein [Aspergillus alliaceus]|uniref:major facilitator superfamily domain-containing protein n=1 Tax=Petromyces alliaceus TaxID=209559 RepID=UPI0012A6E5EB|nr:major facilitator superfamily domain-containing protein [Aspergillus alliaceus]KAB8239286.1 major facilitator superfamily domain-containing protein [Aspergillus alliaceus]